MKAVRQPKRRFIPDDGVVFFQVYGKVREQLEYELSQDPEASTQGIVGKYLRIGMDAVPPEGAIRYSMERAFEETRKYYLGRIHKFFQEMEQLMSETQIHLTSNGQDYKGRLDE